jgi:hypothetical protein
MNAEGQVVYVENFENLLNGYNKQLDLSRFAKGIYALRISTNTRSSLSKIVLQ